MAARHLAFPAIGAAAFAGIAVFRDVVSEFAVSQGANPDIAGGAINLLGSPENAALIGGLLGLLAVLSGDAFGALTRNGRRIFEFLVKLSVIILAAAVIFRASATVWRATRGHAGAATAAAGIAYWTLWH